MNKVSVQNLVKGYSIETTVKEGERVERFSDFVPAGTQIYIAHVPGTDLRETVALAGRLRKEGLEPVPHVVARRMDGLPMVDDFVSRLASEAGVQQVLSVAGDNEPPVGQLHSALQILESGIYEKHGIKKIGVAGHPEGHRAVQEPVLRDALRRKNAYAEKTGANVYVVTQFTFTAEPVIAWENSHGGDIGKLPITVGLPGLASVKTLLKFAMDCGVGASLQAFTKRAASFTKLLTVSTPDTIVVGLARHREQNPQSHIGAVHFFPFGGFKRTAEWANKIASGNFEFAADDGLTTN
jgi:methylenetetrahydrofolate reductase (NADPH)